MSKLLWRSLLLVPLMLASAASASATERVLLAPPGAAQATGPSARSAATLSSTSKETVPGTIARLRATAAKQGTVGVIVGYRVPFAAEGLLQEKDRIQQLQEIAAAGAALRKTYAAAGKRGTGIRTFTSVPFAAMTVTANELNQLLADPNVITIVEDQSLAPQLTYSVPQIGAPAAWELGATGQGQTVAVIDAGFQTSHPFFRDPATGQSKVVYEAGCSGGRCITGKGKAAVHHHGNAVAGIVAGERPESAPGKGDQLKGVAPGARLMVLSASGTGDIAVALDNIYQQRNKFKIAAVNISLAVSRDTPAGRVAIVMDTNTCRFYNPAMSAAIRNLRAAGTATVVASGNHGEKVWGIGSTDKLSYPACLPEAVSVGAVYSNRISAGLPRAGLSFNGVTQPLKTDEVILYSNTAPSLTFLAPSYPIETAFLNGQYVAEFQGTSAAAPHVAGAFAVLRSAAPTATVDQLIEALRLTGKMVKDQRTNLVTPRIDVAQALAYLTGGAKSVIAYTRSGNGSGVVSFAPIASRSSCDDDCNSFVASGTSVTLTAKPEPGTEFLGWEAPNGACRGTSPSCTLTASTKVTPVSAKFGLIKGWASYTLNYSVTGMGRGSVSASVYGKPVECVQTFCNLRLPADTLVTLSVSVGENSTFTGWTGPCSGTAPTCSFALKASGSATAVIKPITMYTLTVVKLDTGTLTATLDGKPVNCSGMFCTLTGRAGAVAKLTATPGSGGAFGGWTGLCSGRTTDCSVTLQSSGMATAAFTANAGKLASHP